MTGEYRTRDGRSVEVLSITEDRRFLYPVYVRIDGQFKIRVGLDGKVRYGLSDSCDLVEIETEENKND